MLELASFGLVVYLGIEVASRDHPADPERRSEVTRAELHTRCEVIGLTKGIHRQRSTYTKQLGKFWFVFKFLTSNLAKATGPAQIACYLRKRYRISM